MDLNTENSIFYPKYRFKDDSCRYYVEFNRNGPNTFTIFERNFLCSKEDWDYRLAFCSDKNRESLLLTGREGHPYQLFNGFCRENGHPDPALIKRIVDLLNKNI